MSKKKASKQDQINIFEEVAIGYRTYHQKIEFFDSSKEEFFTDSNESTS